MEKFNNIFAKVKTDVNLKVKTDVNEQAHHNKLNK